MPKDNENVFHGLNKLDIQKIIECFIPDMTLLDKVKDTLSVNFYKANPSPYNDFSDDEYMQINIPVFDKKGNVSEYSFELKIFENGFISYENGMDVMLRFPNPIKLYKIISEKMKVK